jgi:hypothetical protein
MKMASEAKGCASVSLLPEEIHRRWLAAMRAGDFERAWQATDCAEAARRARGWRDEAAGELLWDGTPFTGRRVLVRCLHGLGDTLQFLRFVYDLRQIAAEVMFAVQPALLPLLAGEPELGRVIDGWVDHWPEYDVEIEVMELAYALRITRSDLPGRVPSLDLARARERARWRPPSQDPGKLKIGLVWQSSRWDRSRSVPIDALQPLAATGAAFYSLQQDTSPEETRALPFPIEMIASETGDPLDAAAAMLWLDLIITVDSMPAHLAGVLGRPVWTLLKEEADWRWMEAEDRSPWYPSMRLFRRRGDWRELIERVASEIPGCVAFRA